MFEFRGAFEGTGRTSGADVSFICALVSVGGVVDMIVVVAAVACDVDNRFEGRDARSGNSAGGGYFSKKRSRRGGSDLAISTVLGALIVYVYLGVQQFRCGRAGVDIKSSWCQDGLKLRK